MTERRIDWTNTLFLITAHTLAVAAIFYMIFVQFSWWTIGLAVMYLAFCGLAITGGYHRLFSHPTYKAAWPLRAFYLFFGAGAVQNSALKWSSDHRIHHARTDEEEDPYNITVGFWWAHIGWVFFKEPANRPKPEMRDLRADPLVMFQDKYYLPLAILVSGLLPLGLGFLWGDPIGSLLVVGFLRLVISWHATFSVNSFAHLLGSQPYSNHNSARDSAVTAVLTLGEGYHNFHHRFQLDYRNGIRWYHLDPTKWFVWTMAKVNVTSDLKRTAQKTIDKALADMRRLREAGPASLAVESAKQTVANATQAVTSTAKQVVAKSQKRAIAPR